MTQLRTVIIVILQSKIWKIEWIDRITYLLFLIDLYIRSETIHHYEYDINAQHTAESDLH